MAVPISQRVPNNEQELYRQMLDAKVGQLRVAEPGIIESFDATTQTAVVQVAVQERIQDPNTLEFKWVKIPLLVDVPIVLPRAGGFTLTLPVQKGDECLVIFADKNFSAWWAYGGSQPQEESFIRRHDLSDGIAILGAWSQPRVISGYSTTSAQLRTDDGSVYIDLSTSGIKMVAPANTITANGTVIG